LYQDFFGEKPGYVFECFDWLIKSLLSILSRKLQQRKQKQLEEEVVHEVEKSSLLSGLVLNFEFPKGGDVKCL